MKSMKLRSVSKRKAHAELFFTILFAAEFTYYLLVLQTGIVSYHHSRLSEIWMLPVGGILGILLSTKIEKQNLWMSLLLAVQMLLSLDYAGANGSELFLLGLISGLTAPMLIARIRTFWHAVGALALSYAFGTYLFDIPASERTAIAVVLSAVAFVASLFSRSPAPMRSENTLSPYEAGSVFGWLLLDAALFETLARDIPMHLWGDPHYTWRIILFHLVGLLVAYRYKNDTRNDLVLLALFAGSYLLYMLGDKASLSILYPFVISYYNVVILYKLYRLAYDTLAVVSLSLWGASGLGLLIALSHTFVLAWAVWLLLCMFCLWQRDAKFHPRFMKG